MIVIPELMLNTLEECEPIKAKDLYARLGKHKVNPDFQTQDPEDDTVPIYEPSSNSERLSRAFNESRTQLIKSIESFEKSNMEDFSELKEYIKNH